MEESKKNGDFEVKKMGWGRGEKMGFTTDFAMLRSSKMGANEIFSHFFFGEVLQGMQKCSTFALAIGKQRSCKRGLRSESDEAAKALL